VPIPKATSEFVDERVPEASRRARRVTIIAQDPAVPDAEGRIIRAAVSIPVDLLGAGPRGQRFHVVDYDAGLGKLVKPAIFTDAKAAKAERGWTFVDRFVKAADAELETSTAFHAQNVYAIAARTLAAFEFALGRRLSWSFSGHQLYLVPHAFREANAYYSAEDRALLFGYIEVVGSDRVLTCLSHDIVAHETTHAVLDGLLLVVGAPPSRSVEVLLVTARLRLLVGQRVGFAFFRPGSNADRFPLVEWVLSQLPVLEPAVVGELPPYLPLEIGVLVALPPPLFEQPALRMRRPRLVEKDLGWAEQRKVIGETGHQLEGYFGARGGVKRGTGGGGGARRGRLTPPLRHEKNRERPEAEPPPSSRPS
jgi:hypothetical protein